MGELLQSQPRPRGPRIENANAEGFHAVGIVTASPRFRTRAEGEEWLRAHVEKLPQSKRPQVRRCMRCRCEFQSEGFHNRMCGPCRHVDEGAADSPYRIIRPSKRG